MSEPRSLSPEAAGRLRIQAAQAFSARGPVSAREFFAGRQNQITRLLESVGQPGLHAVVYGERGVGKTSLVSVLPAFLAALDNSANDGLASRVVVRVNANASDSFASVWRKIFDEIFWEQDRPAVGFRPQPGKELVYFRQVAGLGDDPTVDDVRRGISLIGRSVFIIDEFDRIPRKHAAAFTDLIKSLSDHAVASTIVLVGVAETIEDLVRDHASVSRAIRQIPMPRMSIPELGLILRNAGGRLGVEFAGEAIDRIARLSQGLPHFTHLIGQMAVFNAVDRLSRVVEWKDVAAGIENAVRDSDHVITERYEQAIHSAHAGALYAHVLVAAALAAATDANDLGFFQPASLTAPLTAILQRSEVPIATFNRHLGELCEEKRGKTLERIGQARSFRYRFRDPLLPPYAILRGISDGLVDPALVDRWLADQDR
ncbi:MAG: ATP-binding protein [Phycisphaeraceae bacterium]|nr:ATP-binding protein [Phycisphaeraceae bacterium]